MGLFAVDQWRCDSQLYFLTHMHADHTNGLSSSWKRGPIYCSDVSAGLLLTKFQGFDDTLVHVLEVGSTACLSVPQQDGEPRSLEVTPISANHCPGAVMFLFRGDFGCVLHTGDFRWDAEEESDKGMEQLLTALDGGSVDRLYLDNTFCHPRFKFPPRNVALRQVIEVVANHPHHDIVVGVDSLGKEELLVKIAEAFSTKICVWPERLKTMRLLGLPDVFTTDSTVTRIRAVPRYSMSGETLQILNSMVRPTIGILPTGCICLCRPSCWDVSTQCEEQTCDSDGRDRSAKPTSEKLPSHPVKGGSGQSRKLEHCKCSVGPDGVSGSIHIIKYSLHCSFSELGFFLRIVKPKMVVGMVPSATSIDTDPARHFRCLLKESNLEQDVSPAAALRQFRIMETAKANVRKSTTASLKTKCTKVWLYRRQRSTTFYRSRRKRGGTQLLASLEEEDPLQRTSTALASLPLVTTYQSSGSSVKEELAWADQKPVLQPVPGALLKNTNGTYHAVRVKTEPM